jgi:hypothetical protein
MANRSSSFLQIVVRKPSAVLTSTEHARVTLQEPAASNNDAAWRSTLFVKVTALLVWR